MMLGDQRTKSYDIPLDHLDYKYVEKCNKIDELEKILKILRSGEEGKFPDLEDFTEKKIASMDPNRRILRKDTPAGKTSYLPTDEKQELLDDLGQWADSMSRAQENLGQSSDLVTEDTSLPPVRGAKLNVSSTQRTTDVGDKPKKRVMPRDYKEWDKVDIDKELEETDRRDEEEKKRKQQAGVSGSTSWKGQKAVIDVTGMSEEKRAILATREKDKGNEAYKAGDYDEAIHYYNRSISALQTAAVINNRALTYAKQKKWDRAITDCDKVLELEPGNIKALLRRATGYIGKQSYRNAATDLREVLQAEPNNSKAQSLLKDVNEELEKQAKHGKRMQIEEVDGSSDDESGEEVVVETPTAGKRLQIEEVESDEEEEDGRKTDDSWEIIDKNDCPTEDSSKKVKETTDSSTSDKQTAGKQTAEQQMTDKQTADEQTVDIQTVDIQIVDKEVTESTETTKSEASQSTNQTPEAINVLHESPDPAPVLTLRTEGTTIYKTGDYSKALTVYQRAIEMLEASSGVHNTLLSSLLCNVGSCHKQLGSLRAAVDVCTRAIQLNPRLTKAWLFRAQAQEQREKYAESYVDYRQALSSCGGELMTAQQGAARCQQHLTEQHGAAGWRLQLPQITVKDIELRPASSSTNQPTDKQTDTRTDKQTETQIGEKSSEDTTGWEEHKQTGNDMFKKGNYRAAITAYSSCLRLKPDLTAAYTNRALCRLKLDLPSEALQDCEEALRQEPLNVKAMYRRALAFKALGDFARAVKDLEAVLKVEKTNKAARTELAATNKLWRLEMEKSKTRDRSSPVAKAKTPEIRKSPETSGESGGGGRKVLIEEIGSDEEDEEDVPATAQTEKQHTPDKQTSTDEQTTDKQTSRTAELLPDVDLSTPYNFSQAWNSHSANTDKQTEILRRVQLNKLPEVLGSKLDGHMLSDMVKCAECFVNNDEVDHARLLLKHLTFTKRFATVSMFLTKEERQSLRRTVEAIEKSGLSGGAELRQLKHKFT